MNNEKGFILPITLLVIFLMGSYFTFQINQYAIEKELIFEQGELYTAERLLQKAITDVNEMIALADHVNFSGVFYYEKGYVTYIIKNETNEIKSITLISTTLRKRSKQLTYYYYLNNETVLPWITK